MFKKLIICILLIFPITSFSEDEKKIFQELKVVAENGSPEAQYHLGMLYNNGLGTEKNAEAALKWFKKSAEGGDPLGHYKLGCYYSGQAGNLLPIDENKALEHKLVAAQAGYTLAQDEVAGIYYQRGEYDKAVYWWEQGVYQGDPYSFYKLFSMYYEGKVIPKNIEKSYWLIKIIEKNSDNQEKEKIQPKITDLETQLTTEQISKLNTEIAAWKSERSELTIKAKSGIKETKQVIENAKKM